MTRGWGERTACKRCRKRLECWWVSDDVSLCIGRVWSLAILFVAAEILLPPSLSLWFSCFSVWKEHQYIVFDWNGPWLDANSQVLLRQKRYSKWWIWHIWRYLYCSCMLPLTVFISPHCRLTIRLRRVLWVPASVVSMLSDVTNLGKSVALLVNYAKL